MSYFRHIILSVIITTVCLVVFYQSNAVTCYALHVDGTYIESDIGFKVSRDYKRIYNLLDIEHVNYNGTSYNIINKYSNTFTIGYVPKIGDSGGEVYYKGIIVGYISKFKDGVTYVVWR